MELFPALGGTSPAAGSLVLFLREMESLLDASRDDLARFVGAASSDLVLLRNATAGVNSVFRSVSRRSGDDLLVTDHAYPACRNAVDWTGTDDPDPMALDPAARPSPAWRLQAQLLERYAIEVPVYYWPAPPRRLRNSWGRV